MEQIIVVFAYRRPAIINNEFAAAVLIIIRILIMCMRFYYWGWINFYSLIEAHKVTQSWQSERWRFVEHLSAVGAVGVGGGDHRTGRLFSADVSL